MNSSLYEASRIRKLANEREKMQKMLFTKWINAQLGVDLSSLDDICGSWSPGSSKVGSKELRLPYYNQVARLWGLSEYLFVQELYEDLRDGRILIRLLELLSGQYLVS
ncbi:hypothetical protein PHET_10146 [Paragonimus heterotremus]|uniref:Calponin-homology (CH) domain-containing protein n=1 Tax=Paragonimus heterotremus TaxID=100268 RepID=A0A8J4T8R1_9TREM|nr:hypothetical protein PHET_10146 [Paragonimus heterotremus]